MSTHSTATASASHAHATAEPEAPESTRRKTAATRDPIIDAALTELRNAVDLLTTVRHAVDNGTGNAIIGEENDPHALTNRLEAHEYLTAAESEIEAATKKLYAKISPAAEIDEEDKEEPERSTPPLERAIDLFEQYATDFASFVSDLEVDVLEASCLASPACSDKLERVGKWTNEMRLSIAGMRLQARDMRKKGDQLVDAVRAAAK